jgi:cytochrome P450
VIAEGTTVAVNMAVVNRLRELWGDNAHEFRPERWIEGLPTRAQEISGYRHLLTFLDGPKM